MTKLTPMKAAPLKQGIINDYRDWVAEVKYDGHRVLIDVSGPSSGDVCAYHRPRPDGRQLEEELPVGLAKELARLPRGLYDGELLAGDTATDVRRDDLRDARKVVLFDVLRLRDDTSIVGRSYDNRRALLDFAITGTRGLSRVSLGIAIPLTKQSDVTAFVNTIWKTGGEGAILKRRASLYQVGKRSTDWLKIKRVEHHTLTVVGFKPSRGELRHPGHPFAIVVLKDDAGQLTTCKTKDDHELDQFGVRWMRAMKLPGVYRPHPTGGDLAAINTKHPDLGRQLVIECGGRTRDGGYKGPVTWDRWSDE